MVSNKQASDDFETFSPFLFLTGIQAAVKWKTKSSWREISDNGDSQKREIWSVWGEKKGERRKRVGNKKGDLECRVGPRCALTRARSASRSVGAHLIASAPRDTVDRTSDFQLAMWLIYLGSRKRERGRLLCFSRFLYSRAQVACLTSATLLCNAVWNKMEREDRRKG